MLSAQLFAALLLLTVGSSSAFYLPGVAPQDFAKVRPLKHTELVVAHLVTLISHPYFPIPGRSHPIESQQAQFSQEFAL